MFQLPEAEIKSEYGERTNFPGVPLPAPGESTKTAEIER
jgi:hypothetical protein